MFPEILLSYPYLWGKNLLRKTEFWHLEKLRGLQKRYLLKILRYAADRVPF